jgi:hypothetical protein
MAPFRGSRIFLLCALGALTETMAFFLSSRPHHELVGRRKIIFSSTTAEAIVNTVVPKESRNKDEAAAIDNRNLSQVKADLIDLLATMKGEEAEFRQVENAVNRLEGEFAPIQTLDFFNLLQSGTWQLLFSTQLSGTPNPAKFRLRELTQTVRTDGTTGSWQTRALWDLAPASDTHFTCSGLFGVQHSYKITQGSRCSLTLQEDNNILELSKGSAVPDDIQGLVGLLHRTMPDELFDATGHSADTTYLDDTLRIVRYTGGRLEGVRDIFLRSESFAQALSQQGAAVSEKNEDDSDTLF